MADYAAFQYVLREANEQTDGKWWRRVGMYRRALDDTEPYGYFRVKLSTSQTGAVFADAVMLRVGEDIYPPGTLDLRTDSDNDGDVDAADDPVEMNAPGKLVPLDGDLGANYVDLVLQESVAPGEPLHFYFDNELINVWRYANRTGPVYPSTEWTPATLPSRVYVEALAPASTEMLLTAYAQGDNGPLDDRVRLSLGSPESLVQADIDTDSNNDGGIHESDDPARNPNFERSAPGKVIQYNDDDDNHHGGADYEESGPFENASGQPVYDDDLERARLSWDDKGRDIVDFTLSFAQSGTGSVKVWDSRDKQHELTDAVFTIRADGVADGDEIDLAPGETTVYVEGCAVGDVELSWVMKNHVGVEVNDDTVRFTVVKVAIGVEERVLGSTTWSTPDDHPLIWNMDDHRWTADVNPVAAEQHITAVQWRYKSWEDRQDPTIHSFEFAAADAADASFPYAIGTPPPGDWAIRPVVRFGDGTWVTTTTYDRCVVCDVTHIEWEGYPAYADGLHNLVPPDPTHGDFRFFAEQNRPDEYTDANGQVQPVADHALHNLVNVRVQITPAIPADLYTGGTLDLRVYDPDNALDDGLEGTTDDGDPDTYTPGEEKPDDNYGSGVAMLPVNFEMTFAAGRNTEVTTFSISSDGRRPGNNYLVAVSGDMASGANHYHFREDGVTLYYNQQQPGGGPGVPTDLPHELQSTELTVWRTLWTEVDSMLHPNTQTEPNKRGDFGSGQPYPDDEEFDPHDPDTSFLPSEMARACVRVLPAMYDSRDGIEFWHNLPMVNSNNTTNTVRDVQSEQDFWSAHIVGVYEPGVHPDPQYNPEDNAMDYDGENAWHIGQSDKPVLIYEEVIRDLSQNYSNAQSQPMIEAHIVLHEVLHRFYGPHGQPPLTEFGAMSATTCVIGNDAANVLTRQQLRYIQYKASPSPHPDL